MKITLNIKPLSLFVKAGLFMYLYFPDCLPLDRVMLYEFSHVTVTYS